MGENKQASVTDADREMVTDMDVILSGTWFAVPKYSGTKASQMTHVVYMVKPVNRISAFADVHCAFHHKSPRARPFTGGARSPRSAAVTGISNPTTQAAVRCACDAR